MELIGQTHELTDFFVIEMINYYFVEKKIKMTIFNTNFGYILEKILDYNKKRSMLACVIFNQFMQFKHYFNQIVELNQSNNDSKQKKSDSSQNIAPRRNLNHYVKRRSDFDTLHHIPSKATRKEQMSHVSYYWDINTYKKNSKKKTKNPHTIYIAIQDTFINDFYFTWDANYSLLSVALLTHPWLTVRQDIIDIINDFVDLLMTNIVNSNYDSNDNNDNKQWDYQQTINEIIDKIKENSKEDVLNYLKIIEYVTNTDKIDLSLKNILNENIFLVVAKYGKYNIVTVDKIQRKLSGVIKMNANNDHDGENIDNDTENQKKRRLRKVMNKFVLAIRNMIEECVIDGLEIVFKYGLSKYSSSKIGFLSFVWDRDNQSKTAKDWAQKNGLVKLKKYLTKQMMDIHNQIEEEKERKKQQKLKEKQHK